MVDLISLIPANEPMQVPKKDNTATIILPIIFPPFYSVFFVLQN